MKERVVAILPGRGRDTEVEGREEAAVAAGSSGKSSTPLSRRPLRSTGFQLGLQIVSFGTDIALFFLSSVFSVLTF
jgi:hypothetical protein